MAERPAKPDKQSSWTNESEPIEFPAGIPGFEEHKRFVLQSRPDMHPFLWLKSMEDEEIALPIISCRLLREQARPELSEKAATMLGAAGLDDVASYFILKVDPNSGSITANTKAPILLTLSNSRGYQIYLDRKELSDSEPLVNLVPPPLNG